ncbi:MAG: ATP-binding protein [Saprospiraceae bacterium]
MLKSPLWNLGLFFGTALFSLLVALIRYIVSKDRAYLFYSIFVIFNLLYFLHYYEYYGGVKVLFNFIFETLAPDIRIVFLLLGYVFYNYFAIEFLQLNEVNSKLAMTLKRCAWLIIGVIIIHLIFFHAGWNPVDGGFSKYKKLHDFTIISAAAIEIYAIFKVYQAKSTLSKILVLGATLFFFGSFFGFILTVSTDFVSPLLQEYPLLPTQIGFLCEVLFFSIGLAYRTFLFEKEKDLANEKYIQKLQENLQLELERKDALKYREINNLKSRLYTNITHEFRTPLTVIMGMTEELKENPKINLENRLQTIQRNSGQLLDLVNQLLELNRLEEGAIKPKFLQGQVIQYLKYLTESYQSFAWSKQKSLSFHSEVEDGFLMDYDGEKLQRILINLLSNAIKFTPELGQVKVAVKKNFDHNSLIIIVKDTGEGIPEEALSHVFERFYQVDNSSTRSIQGTGIGLALVKEMTELLDGNVLCKSIVGKGTTFELSFPINNNATLESSRFEILNPSLTTIKNENGEEEPINLEGEKPILLIVEDNDDVAEYLKSCLTPHYQFLFAKNGKIGLDEALEKIPDIIISDVMMPEMDGFELCQKLKNDPRTNHIPIILLTAKSTNKDKLEGLSKGADAYLEKPFDKEELLIRLQQLILLRKNIMEKNNLEVEEQPEDKFLQKIHQIVLGNIEDSDFDVSRLVAEMEMSRTQIHRKIKALTDQSTTHFVRVIRMQEAKKMLVSTSFNVSEVAYKVGYKNPTNFSTHFKAHFGFPPSQRDK